LDMIGPGPNRRASGFSSAGQGAGWTCVQ
jgi:hypothetical protein